MPMTNAEHERKLKAPAVCELLPLRDLPIGDNIMVRTSGAFVAGYELRGVLAYFATDSDRNQTKSMLEALFRSVPDVSMRIQFRYEISEHLGDLARQLHPRTAHRAVGSDGARYPSAQDVAAEREQWLLFREPVACVLHLGSSPSREALSLSTTEPQSWWIHSEPEEGHPADTQGA